MSKQNGYKRITITIPKELLERFRKFCKKNAINMSGRISNLIEIDIEDEPRTKKEEKELERKTNKWIKETEKRNKKYPTIFK